MNKLFSPFKRKSWGLPLKWRLGAVFLSILVYLVWTGSHSNANQPLRLVVYAFSTQEEVLTQAIFPAFEQAWEAQTGTDVVIEGVFGPSETLSVEINLGAPADVAIFSNQRHIDWLKFSKCVDRNTEQVMIASTPLVIITRPGNPAKISDFADLIKPGLQLLHGDPNSSGVGEWAVLAEYGSAYLETGNNTTAEAQLKNIWKNVRLVGSSARTTLTLFELGAGDALVTYEQDAYFAQGRGVPLEIIMPQRTILARHFAVTVDENVTSVERPVVEAFLTFLLNDEGQQILRQYYFRPVTIESDLLPDLIHPFTEENLGGWTHAYNNLIENYWKTEIEPGPRIETHCLFPGARKITVQESQDTNLTPRSAVQSQNLPLLLELQEIQVASTVQVAWWERIRLGKVILFMLSIFLFTLAITLMKDGARGIAPFAVDFFKVGNSTNALGFGWFFAYLVMSGSPIAAVSLAFLDAGVIGRFDAFAMIVGSRIGAAFIVLFIGFIYILRGHKRKTALTTGLLSLVVTGSIYFPALGVGHLLLQYRILDPIQFSRGTTLSSVLGRAFEPILEYFSNTLPGWTIFLVGLGIILVSFKLFDWALPDFELKQIGLTRAARLVYRPMVMFLFGSALTLFTMSVSLSLSALVPLSVRGYVRRENVIPYIMGANITTLVDTLLASVLLSNTDAFTVVLATVISTAVISLIGLLFYQTYEQAMLSLVTWISTGNRNLTLFMFAIFIIPLILILV